MQTKLIEVQARTADAINHRDPRFNPLEMAQKARAVIWNWLDAIVDVLAGNVAFLVIYLCIIK